MPANIPQTMTEIAITQPGDADVLQSRVVDVPAPGRGELLVRVVAAGVNRPDIMQRQGNYPMPPGVNPTPGLEVAGTIVAVGDQGKLTCTIPTGELIHATRYRIDLSTEIISPDPRIAHTGLHHVSRYLEHLDFLAFTIVANPN